MAGAPIVDNCMAGYNSCVFAYGQTGAGKTHTMQGRLNGGGGASSSGASSDGADDEVRRRERGFVCLRCMCVRACAHT